MSGTFPSSPVPRHIRVRTHQPTRVSLSHSLKRQARTRNAQRWSFVLDFPPLTRAELQPIFAHVVSQRGEYDTFQWVFPSAMATPLGVGAIGSPTPYADSSTSSPTENQTGRSIITTGWPVSSTVLKAGDFFKFASHSKVYMARSDILSDSAGAATLAMEPSAVEAISHGDTIITSSVPFTVALANDVNEFDWDLATIFGLSLELVEDF